MAAARSMVSRTDKGIRASIRDMGISVVKDMAFPPYLLNTGFIRTRQVILSGLYIRVPRFSVRRTRRDAESGKAIKASPAGRCAGLDRPPLASGKKSSRATDEEVSGRGSVKGIWRQLSARQRESDAEGIDDRNACSWEITGFSERPERCKKIFSDFLPY